MTNWFTKLFINQVTPALEYYSRTNSGSSEDDTQMYILIDENGNEFPAVVVEEETVFNATANDIREGKVAATDEGVTVGTKDIPSYNTQEGYKLITDDSEFVLYTTHYDYTKLQVIFCPFNTSPSKSVVAEKVVIDDNVYPVGSSEAISAVVKDITNARIDFGITNESGSTYLIRYILYKEIY